MASIALMRLRTLRFGPISLGRFLSTSDGGKDPGQVRVRFAPSPTGFVHIGSLRAIAYNFLFARSHPGGRFILRIEDTDRGRIVDGAAEQLESTLEWLGMSPDESPLKGGLLGPYVQSQRIDLYREAVEKLLREGKAYRCFCTEERLALMRKEALKNRQSLRYDNFCRHLTPEEIEEKLKTGTPFGIRFILQNEPSSIVDAVFGNHHYPVAEHEGDPVILKSDGYPTYHLANVVDDQHMRITHVIRGEEWLSSTVKHAQLYAAFGWTPPIFAHVPVMTQGKNLAKLSKRDAAANLDSFRKSGYYPLALINSVLCSGGGFDPQRKDKNCMYSLEELTEMFDLSKLMTRATKFEREYLDKYNRIHLKALPRSQLIADFRRSIEQKLSDDKTHENENLESESFDDEYLNRILDQYLPDSRMTTLVELFENPDHAFLWRYDQSLHPDLRKPIEIQKSILHPPELVDVLNRLISDLEKIKETSTIDELKKFLADFEKRSGVNHRLIFHAIRLMITNSPRGLPIGEMFYLLGQYRTIKRLRHGIDQLKIAMEEEKAPMRSG